MRSPLRYLRVNVGGGLAAIEACIRHDVPCFVLSSTASLFGNPDRVPIDDTARVPGSRYGQSKLMIEQAPAWAEPT
jgi:UDP-glucose 4-epimerase